jgi:hypothetical protein
MTEPERTAPGADGVRVSTVVGDRLCIRCGFNLHGQSVVREPHYSLLIARCPECGMAAALQEYPLLGRWAGRWAAVLAGLWLLVLTAFLFATAGVVGGMSIGIAGDFARDLATHISFRHNEWVRSLPDADTTLGQNAQWIKDQPDNWTSWVATTWWTEQDPGALQRELGGVATALDWTALWMYPWLALLATIAGAVWSVVLLGVPTRRVIALAIIPVLLAGAGAAASVLTADQPWLGSVESAHSLAEARLSPLVLPPLIVSALLWLWLGVWLGRPVVRGMVRTLLPPRMLGAMAFLWTAEGREPPRPARR